MNTKKSRGAAGDTVIPEGLVLIANPNPKPGEIEESKDEGQELVGPAISGSNKDCTAKLGPQHTHLPSAL